jgi:serine/threonine-protein kinase
MKTCPICEKSWPSNHANCPTDGALLIDSRELEPGTVIRGKYRIVRQLGRGGMGTVYLAEHILLNRPRALKFISSELSQDAAFLRRFRREAQAAIELRHPNVVEVVDLDQAEDGSPYIAMEYVEGPDLRHALAAGSFPVERALHIARGIALGLGAAHAKGIIHRDVKPENILLASGHGALETPKLLDFGIAAMKESATVASHTHGLLLTPPYAAPEQWKGMAAEELDGRADLYALGGVFNEMLTGKTCFHAHNTEGWMYQHLQEQPQPPSQLRPELADWPGLDALVLRLLAKDREQRPRDAAELVRMFDAVLHKDSTPHPRFIHPETVIETPPPFIPPPDPILWDPEPSPALVPSRTLPIKWLVAAALLILAVAGIWLATRPSNKAPSASVPSGIIDADALVWTDPATGLTWAKKDNGSDVNFKQATDYCRNLQLAGHSDWRLPAIGELQDIYDPKANVGGYQVKGNLQLSGWHWSSSLGNASGEAWRFFFYEGGVRASGPFGLSHNVRALCVRGSTAERSNQTPNPAPVIPASTPGGGSQTNELTWTDPATGLMWAKKDNGSNVTWQQATAYCQNLQLAGHSDWRLPTIDELQGIYDPKADVASWRVKGNLQISGYQWSSSPGKASGEAWYFFFSDGERGSDRFRKTYDKRALCVLGAASQSASTAPKPAPVIPSPTPDAGAQADELTWTDPATGLMWTKKENGSGSCWEDNSKSVNWQQATDYCRNLRLAGHSDWRLPTIGELQGIYDPNANVSFKCWHVKGCLQSDSTLWSSPQLNVSQGGFLGTALGFQFSDGTQGPYSLDSLFCMRALCVRRSR